MGELYSEDGFGGEDGLGFSFYRAEELALWAEAEGGGFFSGGETVGFAGGVVEEHPGGFDVFPLIGFGGAFEAFEDGLEGQGWIVDSASGEGEAGGEGGDFGGEGSLVEIEAEADDGDFSALLVGIEFGEDASEFFAAEGDVVGPAELGSEGGGDGEGEGHAEEPGAGVVGVLGEDEADGEGVAGLADPGALETAAALGLVDGADDAHRFAASQEGGGFVLG